MKQITLLLCAIGLFILSSCSSQKPTLSVFKDLQEIGDGSIDLPDYEIKIRPQDDLYITVTSMDPSATAPYNLPMGNPAVREELQMAQTPRQQTFIVDKEGNIDRTNVLIVREKDGKAVYHKVDLTKSDIVSSPYFYLQQNDVVMVSPTPVKESNSRYDTNSSYRMQVVSTIVSGASVIASLIIALTVK